VRAGGALLPVPASACFSSPTVIRVPFGDSSTVPSGFCRMPFHPSAVVLLETLIAGPGGPGRARRPGTLGSTNLIWPTVASRPEGSRTVSLSARASAAVRSAALSIRVPEAAGAARSAAGTR
jgi:hypothetical protein